MLTVDSDFEEFDASAKHARQELRNEMRRAEAASGKNQIMQQVRNAYAHPTTKDPRSRVVQARMAFDKLIS
jgi:hypothetical protein